MEVVEIAQENLEANLIRLKENAEISFTDDHYAIYDDLMQYTSNFFFCKYKEGRDKLLLAKNEYGTVVGAGIVSFNDANERDAAAALEYVLSVQKGAGTAITNAIIDYSRQMLHRTSIKVCTLNTNLRSYYAQFGFTADPYNRLSMVRRNSGVFDPNVDIEDFEPTEKTKNEVAIKRRQFRGL